MKNFPYLLDCEIIKYFSFPFVGGNFLVFINYIEKNVTKNKKDFRRVQLNEKLSNLKSGSLIVSAKTKKKHYDENDKLGKSQLHATMEISGEILGALK